MINSLQQACMTVTPRVWAVPDVPSCDCMRFNHASKLAYAPLAKIQHDLSAVKDKSQFEKLLQGVAEFKKLATNKRRLKQELANAWTWCHAIQQHDFVVLCGQGQLILGQVQGEVQSTLHPDLKVRQHREVTWLPVALSDRLLDASTRQIIANKNFCALSEQDIKGLFLNVLEQLEGNWQDYIAAQITSLFTPACLAHYFPRFYQKPESQLVASVENKSLNHVEHNSLVVEEPQAEVKLVEGDTEHSLGYENSQAQAVLDHDAYVALDNDASLVLDKNSGSALAVEQGRGQASDAGLAQASESGSAQECGAGFAQANESGSAQECGAGSAQASESCSAQASESGLAQDSVEHNAVSEAGSEAEDGSESVAGAEARAGSDSELGAGTGPESVAGAEAEDGSESVAGAEAIAESELGMGVETKVNTETQANTISLTQSETDEDEELFCIEDELLNEDDDFNESLETVVGNSLVTADFGILDDNALMLDKWSLVGQATSEHKAALSEIVERMHIEFDGRLASLMCEMLQAQGMDIESCRNDLIFALSKVDNSRYLIYVCETVCTLDHIENVINIATQSKTTQNMVVAWRGQSEQIPDTHFSKVRICSDVNVAQMFLNCYPFLSEATRQRLALRKLWCLA